LRKWLAALDEAIAKDDRATIKACSRMPFRIRSAAPADEPAPEVRC